MKPNELKLGIVIRGPLLPEPIEVLVATALDDRRRSCRPRSLARIDFGSAHLHAGEAAHGRTPDRDRGSAPSRFSRDSFLSPNFRVSDDSKPALVQSHRQFCCPES